MARKQAMAVTVRTNLSEGRAKVTVEGFRSVQVVVAREQNMHRNGILRN